MRQRFFIAVEMMAVLSALVFFGLYEYGGGRYYLEMADLVNRKTGEEKVKLSDKVFGDPLVNLYGRAFNRADEEGFTYG
jgi:hypothetical protein